MSDEDLRTLLTELADEVTRVQLVAPAIARAARVRRRRAGVAAGVVLAVAAAVGVAALRPTAPPPPVAGPTPSPSIVVIPGAPAVVTPWPASLPVEPYAARYWPASVQPPADTRWLVDAPLRHAVLLYLPPRTPGAAISYLYAYGEAAGGAFGWVKVPVDLADTAGAVPLSSNSLAPMGLRAAFAQPDAVVVVDLSTGGVVRIPVPGAHTDVTWLADGRHLLVSGPGATSLVDVDTRTAMPAAVAGSTVAPLVGGGSGLTALTLDGAGSLVLRGYDDAGLVVDERMDRVTRILDLGAGRTPGCCAVLGWLDPFSVLVYTDRDGLLRWTLGTGAVTRLTLPWAGTVSIAPAGCDWWLTIGPATATCTT
jgi:hypothetical protein